MPLSVFRQIGSRMISIVLFALTVVAGQAEETSTLQLSFRHVISGNPVLLDSLRYENPSEETFSFSRVSYLLSEFSLETQDGTRVALPDQVAWIDVARKRTAALLSSIPKGKYRSLRFHIGLKAQDNHRGTASYPADHPLNPNLNGLHWSWQGGYIFLALEGKFRTKQSSLSGYSYHLARTPNRTAVELSGDFDLKQPLSSEIDFDLFSLLNVPLPLSFQRDGSSTHSREGDPIAKRLVQNLPGAFRVRRFYSNIPEIMRASDIKPLYMPTSYTAYPFKISRTFPIPNLPRDNPLIQERVDLGEKLFHETGLSRDGTITCASCHLQSHALTDPLRFSVGIDNQTGSRNAMPLFNLAWKSSFFWDGRAPSLRAQALMPIVDHTEMDEKLENVVAKLSKQESYREAFANAFDPPEITPERIGLALESFLLSQTSYHSKFDQALKGKVRFTPSEQRGFELFMTEYEPRSGRFGADCFHCHGGPLFTDHQFHNNGLDDITSLDLGRYQVTSSDADKAKFSTPSLRNVALTAPYMHDGRFLTLSEVIKHYNSGLVRSNTLDANLAKHPAKGLELSLEDQKALVDFLETLTDPQYQAAEPQNK